MRVAANDFVSSVVDRTTIARRLRQCLTSGFLRVDAANPRAALELQVRRVFDDGTAN